MRKHLPVIQDLPDGINSVLVFPFLVALPEGRKIEDKRCIVIPAGFKTDWASSPLGIIFKRRGKHSVAALVHDFLYRQKKHQTSRAEADQIFLDLMERAKVNFFIRRAAYYAVRACGWRFWR